MRPAFFSSLPLSSTMGWMGCPDCIPDSPEEVPVHVARLTSADPLSPMSSEILSSCQVPGHSCLYQNRATLQDFPFPSLIKFHESLCTEQDNLSRVRSSSPVPYLAIRRELLNRLGFETFPRGSPHHDFLYCVASLPIVWRVCSFLIKR